MDNMEDIENNRPIVPANIRASRKYQNHNREKVRAIALNYYTKNKDEINRKRREKYALKKLENALPQP